MAGKIFYRKRCNSKEGSKSPRYRIVAVAGCDLKVYGNHFRKNEIKQIADALGAELVLMERGERSKDH